jgi:DNA-binding CsgD family transcriptional regulator
VVVLVGREREVGRIRGALDDHALVMVVGAAGIGKTTVARAALGEDRRETGALATLRSVPLFPFTRLMSRASREAPGLSVERTVRALLRQGSTPLLVDDLQWADDASLEVLAALAGRIPLVVTIRATGEGSEAARAVVELLGGEPVELEPLAPDASTALVRAAYPELARREQERIVAAAGGVPLLLHELPKGTRASVTLVGVLLERMAGLSPAGQEAAERLAVLGRPASDTELGPGASELVDAGFATNWQNQTGFVHMLLGEVIEEQMGDRSRAVRQRLAPLVDKAEAARLLEAAGDRAHARALALEAAETELDPRHRAELLVLAVRCEDGIDVETRVQAGRLLTATSQPLRAIELCDLPGIDGLEPLARGLLRGCLAEAAWTTGDHRRSARLIELALPDVAGSRTAEEVEVLAGSTAVNTFVDLDGRPALARAEAAVALADELGVKQAYARSRLASVWVMAGREDWESRYREALVFARAEGDDRVYSQTFVGLILARWSRGDVARAAELARIEMEAHRSGRFDVAWLGVAAYAALLSLLAGTPPDEVIAHYAPILDREPYFRSRAFLEAAVILAHSDGGQHAEAERRGDGVLDRSGADPQGLSVAAWARVEAAWLAGRPREALDRVHQVVALGVGDYPSAVMARLIGAHAARELAVDPVGESPTIALPAWRAAPIEWSAIAAARDGDAERASSLFLEAAEAWTSSDARSELRCRWAAGDVLVGDDSPRAAVLLDGPLERALTLGAAAWANRVRRSLRNAGVRRRSGPAEVRGGLTLREAQVIEMVGAGMKTTAIAAALGLEASTVESVVRSATRKLGVPTRMAAAAELERRRTAHEG